MNLLANKTYNKQDNYSLKSIYNIIIIIIMINYNYSFICTYKELNQDYYSNLCYQIQLLQVFNMDKYDEYILQKNIESVYIFLRDNNYIKEIFKLLQEKLPCFNCNSISRFPEPLPKYGTVTNCLGVKFNLHAGLVNVVNLSSLFVWISQPLIPPSYEPL